MRKRSTVGSANSSRPLLEAFLEIVAAHRPAFRQTRTFQRCLLLMAGHLLAFARHTVTQLLVALGLGLQDWSAYYRLFSLPRLAYPTLRQCFFRQTLPHVPADQPYVVAVDGVQIPRSSRTMPGTAWLKAPRTPPWKPGIHRAQRFSHLAWLLPRTPEGYSRAVPLCFDPAFPPKAVLPEGLAPRKEWEAGLEGLRWLRSELGRNERESQLILGVGDRAYDTKGLWASLPPHTAVLARTIRSRALFALPQPHVGRGRRRRYGERARSPAQWLAEREGWSQTTVAVRGREIPLTYRVEGPYLVQGAPDHPLFLLVVRGTAQAKRRIRREPSFYLVNAVWHENAWQLPLEAEELLAWAWQRWEIEVSHREMKAGLGVGQMQCWNVRSAVLAPQWQVWLYGVLVLAGYRAWGLGQAPLQPLGAWWPGSRRWSIGMLWQGMRQALWGTAEFRALCASITDNWWEKADWLASQTNAALGARRA